MFFLKQKKIPITDFFTDKFVDIHSHLLPGIDDGAKTMEDSIALIKRMNSYGIKNIITTPHILGDVYPNRPFIIKQKLEEVKQELIRQNLGHIKISAGAEHMMDQIFLELLQEDQVLPLKDEYLLVEMSYFNPPVNLYDIIFQIQLKGFKPVLAHPERYNFYHDDINNFYKLKKAGCFFQLNLLSLTDQYGRRVKQMALKMIDENLYDFVGTDTHHLNHLNLLKTIATKKNFKKINRLLSNNYIFI